MRLPAVVINCTTIRINSTDVNRSPAGTLSRVRLTWPLDHSDTTAWCRPSFAAHSSRLRPNKNGVDGYGVPTVQITIQRSTAAWVSEMSYRAKRLIVIELMRVCESVSMIDQAKWLSYENECEWMTTWAQVIELSEWVREHKWLTWMNEREWSSSVDQRQWMSA